MYKTCSYIFTGLSLICCPLGIAAFVYFLFYVSNVNAAFWSALFAILSACSLHLFILFLRRTINNWYQENHLDSIASFGLVVFLLSNVALGVYLALAITRHQKFHLEDFNYFSAASCSALTSLWALILFISALLYRKYMQKNPPLLQRYRFYS
ncbi:uncharacterized protein LOC129960824 [Argiope bruennichi]|uniref:Uncharacterized protein n=1 Tax=Argiope bruennichi TaxID=94029 RepID=A0A8T0FKC9_ARGBR|nr:uncharacterized protein LOC129960824 [Argiope bruennichi]KAF8790902.1 hypothetical protein HNY73_005848 [Argiope bruennichi]